MCFLLPKIKVLVPLTANIIPVSLILNTRGKIATKSKQHLFVRRVSFFLGHWIWELRIPPFPHVPLGAILEHSPE